MKHIAIGILAHVDAGKTTLSEAMLYAAGAIDRMGRVDKKDAHLDTHALERERGITIFSKQAVLTVGDTSVTLIDTPGHIDFSAETERALAVEDFAILVVSATEGVQSHTGTLWKLLRARHIPTFLFVNKTDIAETDRADLLRELREKLSPRVTDFTSRGSDGWAEDAAGATEELMHEFFETGTLSDGALREAIRTEGIFPCFFGSALRYSGVKELLTSLDELTSAPAFPSSLFGARVYKIATAPDGTRLTYMKLTGGRLMPKDTLSFRVGEETATGKVEEIRIYSGEKYKSVREAVAGQVIAVPGLPASRAGQGLGFEHDDETALEPVLDYRMVFAPGEDVYAAYLKLLTLLEEDPALALSYDPKTRDIRVRLMGEIQMEILRRVIAERFGLDVTFSEGTILYKETIAAPARGSGHFEPLRHYAEVRLLLEPLPRGSGIVVASEVPTDLLAIGWQRLVLSHLEERMHRGRLVGAPITDMKITLVAGRAHLKHTEGGDFRQATFRALRQGLMKSDAVLLEPTFDFEMDIPATAVGHAMTDITARYGTTEAPVFEGDRAILRGNAPVSTMRSYATELRAFTRGEGKITFRVGEYCPCHNADEVIAASGYDPELDERNPAGSVFCRGGAGVSVPWREVDALMHTDDPEKETAEPDDLPAKVGGGKASTYHASVEEDKELMRIFEATYGKITPRKAPEKRENLSEGEKRARKPKMPKPRGEEVVIVDCYNLIYAWEPLAALAAEELAHARETLIGILANYAGFRRCRLIAVFDAYRREDNPGSVETVCGISVVYTKEAQTADAYIERTTHDLAPDHYVRVVTSDLAEQYVIFGNGAYRVSAREFIGELELVSDEIRKIIDELETKNR